jgi:hypothetical protein
MSTLIAEPLVVRTPKQPQQRTARVKLNIGGREVEVDVVLFTNDLVEAIREVQKQLRRELAENGSANAGAVAGKLISR